jgi:hypothetical protein
MLECLTQTKEMPFVSICGNVVEEDALNTLHMTWHRRNGGGIAKHDAGILF